MSVSTGEWLKLFRQEYLDSFISEGGSVVKVLVGNADVRQSLITGIEREAVESGYLVAKVDAACTRVHMVQEVFFAVARQIDWDTVTDQWVRLLFQEKGITVPDDVDLHNISAIAEASGSDTSQMHTEMKVEIRSRITHYCEIARDFRIAARLLAFAAISRDEETVRCAETVKAWLTNQPAGLATLKALQLSQRIGRHNARLMLHSLALFVRSAGYSGLCVIIDLAALHAKAPAPESIKYTRLALLDAYEMLRLFIDETDESAFLAVTAVADDGFIDGEKRSYEQYNALKMRLFLDVTATISVGVTQENPLTAMVRLSDS
jgi:hypothetical protein